MFAQDFEVRVQASQVVPSKPIYLEFINGRGQAVKLDSLVPNAKKEVVFKSSSAVQFLPSLYLGPIATHASMAFSFLNESLDSACHLCSSILGRHGLFWNQCNKKSA